MTTVLGSRRSFLDYTDLDAIEFLETVCDITAIPEYLKLKDCVHHYGTTRYQHCLNVAWYTFMWCKIAGLDYKSAARGAMLHDFFFYDWRHKEERPMEGNHCKIHPQIAYENATKHFEVNDVMKDCIVNHMWPMTPHMPKTKEGFIITLADKYCASLEVGSTGTQKISPLVRQFLRKMEQ